MLKRTTKLSAVVTILLLSMACLHKQGGLSISPWERVMTDNAAFAQLNGDAEQGVELVQASGLLSVEQARPILHFHAQVATAHKQITAILALGPTADLSGVNPLLDQIQASAGQLLATGTIGVKNPKTQQSVTADINNIVALAKAIVSDIQLVKSAKGGQ